MLIKGEKPAALPVNKVITKRDWELYLRPIKEYPNPIKVGFKFAQYLRDHPESTYNDLAAISGISKARVCQMVALYNRLPTRITEYLTNTNKLEILKYFTEKRLRPLTLLSSDDDKVLKFNEMMETIV